MQWPKGLALRELFGFYDFTNDNGEKMTGFSKGVGSLWLHNNVSPRIIDAEAEDNLIATVKSASDAWQRKQKKGADIGSVVHDAIEHYIKNQEFDIEENYLWTIKESEFESEVLREKAMIEMPLEVEQAKKAFLQFQLWWDKSSPTLHSAEDILYSLEHNICGTYDADLTIDGKRITADWKTSNASTSVEAAAPEGVYYSYFVQLGIYELMRREMELPPADDLLTVSARKDGSFSLVYASELGLSVQDCLDWAECVIKCYRLMDKSKKALLEHGKPAAEAVEVINSKGEF